MIFSRPSTQKSTHWIWYVLLPVLLVIAYSMGQSKHREQEQVAADFAKAVPGRLESPAKGVMARACNMLDWIDHLQLKRGEPLPAELILSDGRAPWEPLPHLEDILTRIEAELGDSQQFEVMVARERISALRSASNALRSSVADLLTAQVAMDAGRPATAKSKFESARKDAQHAVSRVEEAMEALPAQPILEGGSAIMMTTSDPCDAL